MLEHMQRLRYLQSLLQQRTLQNEETTPYVLIFSEVPMEDWRFALKRVLLFCKELQKLPPFLQDFRWHVERLDRRIRQIPFNCANPNLAQARIDMTEELLDYQAKIDALSNLRGFLIDYMQRLNTALHMRSEAADTLRTTFDQLFTRSPLLAKSFKPWLNTDITCGNTDFDALIDESANGFNEIRKNGYSPRGV